MILTWRHIEQSKAEFIRNLPKYDVQVEVDRVIMKRLRFTGKFVRVIETEHPSNGQWISATVRFNDEQEAIEFLLGFENKLKVISPKDLPNKIVALAKSVIEFNQSVE
ncbi:hypothetical protein J32TS6_36690 [Virgibacillus pantothenticus]|nr:WYL domain-containing protein [Virgibacillus pantothenticus]GIP65114.1 hypothetical protein J32TS6_36690 [Virgibacillus pantothenticus]